LCTNIWTPMLRSGFEKMPLRRVAGKIITSG